MVVLDTGASGQLGQALQFISTDHPDISFKFATSSEADVTNRNILTEIFNSVRPNFCINAAAYTAVDKAESEPEKAELINVAGALNVAEACKCFDTTLIHISTDFVFDGSATTPYTEEHVPNPMSVYGKTKLDGERAIADVWDKHIIIRTSWLYSQFSNNFMKAMLRIATERISVSVVNDQIGTPTHAVDLAKAILDIIRQVAATLSTLESRSLTDQPSTIHQLQPPYGTYHFSNEGQCSWYDFAKKIFEVNNIEIDLHPIPTSAFPTAAKRPRFSVLDKEKIAKVFNIRIREWENALTATKQ